jgi:hypothetical protein
MPSSVPIAAFVLGGVLLLVAILGGKFKLFGAEISEAAGKPARWFAGLLGCCLTIVGLGLSAPAATGPTDTELREVKETVARAVNATIAALNAQDPSGLEAYLEGDELSTTHQQIAEAKKRATEERLRATMRVEGVAFDTIAVTDEGTRAEARVRVTLSVDAHRGTECFRAAGQIAGDTYFLRRAGDRWMIYLTIPRPRDSQDGALERC